MKFITSLFIFIVFIVYNSVKWLFLEQSPFHFDLFIVFLLFTLYYSIAYLSTIKIITHSNKIVRTKAAPKAGC